MCIYSQPLDANLEWMRNLDASSVSFAIAADMLIPAATWDIPLRLRSV